MKFNTLPVLLAGTFLTTSAVAQTVPTINTDYLNSLTGEKITWEDATASDEDTVQIDDKFYKYTYHKPDNYTETSEHIDDTLSTSDVTDVIFKEITSGNSVIFNTVDNSNINIDADFIKSNPKYIEPILINATRYYSGIVASIGNITGDFIANIGTTIDNNGGIIGDIVGNFVGNYIGKLDGYNSWVIHNYPPVEPGEKSIHTTNSYKESKNIVGGIINSIKGNFIGNYGNYGSIILNNGTIKTIEANFIGNHGAIYNRGIINSITGNFINNGIVIENSFYSSSSAAIENTGTIGSITSDFVGNQSTGTHGDIRGSAINNHGKIDYISGNFINNIKYVEYVPAYDVYAAPVGGAIYTTSDLTFKADAKNYYFSGNYVKGENGLKTNNAIWVQNSDTLSHPTLEFKLTNGGAFVFDDGIDGGYYFFISDAGGLEEIFEQAGYGYNINLSGDAYNTSAMDETNTIRFNDLVNNVYDFSIDSVQMALGKNAVVNIVHNYVAQNNPYLRLDLDAVNRKVGQLNIDGDVDGTTNVIVNVLQNKETAKEESIVFATAVNDTLGDEDSFTVSRVIGSPYMWEVSYNDTEKQWGLYSTEEQNPDEEDDPVVPTPDTPSQPLGPIKVAPEVIATVAVKTAGLSQTNGMVYNIMRKVGVNRLFCPGCGFYDYNWDGEAFHNVWVDTTYNGLTIEAPVEIDAKVWGIEAGSDLQHDLNNKLGIFVSYRQGNYEMDGKGEKYYSNIGSEIDIDSYLAGLYYRYDNNNWYAFATVYGGMQNAEIKTDDGVSADTDGIEFGGSVEGGYNYALTRTLSVTPSLGVFYSQISYDDATDNVGKTVNYNDLKQVELEAGAKFAYTQYTDDGFYSLYVKPSVVQTLIDGDEIEVTKLGEVDTVEDKTLGRVEIGGNYGFNDNWSAYGWANYTFGSDYEATSLGLGLNYAW